MGRLLVFAVLASLLCRAVTGRWPWALWRESELSQKEAQARSLLGLGRSATRSEIAEAHRRVLVQVHPDRGGSNAAVHAASAARDLLLARLNRIETGQS